MIPFPHPSTPCQAAFNAWWKDNAIRCGLKPEDVWPIFRAGWWAMEEREEVTA